MKTEKLALMLVILLLGLVVAGCGVLEADTGGSFKWQAFSTAAEAGYSDSEIERALDYYKTTDATALLVLVDDKVLINQGDTNRRFFSTSIRKSFLNALIGQAVERGRLDLSATLAELNIDDNQSLTEAESQATIEDLLASRSGIYLPAAFEDPAWADRRPSRNAHPPGEHWYYNNWDFNVLGEIYERAVDSTVFQAFEEQVADPIGMQDYRLIDGAYFDEPEKSSYPAYLFKMSARDMARFGLLYLQQGRWQGEQVVPEGWVQRSLEPRSLAFDDGTSYGYLWWYQLVDGYEVHYAHGAGNQGIFLVPEQDMVFVIRADTYGTRQLTDDHIFRLLSMVLAADEDNAVESPDYREVNWPGRLPEAELAEVADLEDFLGDYQNSQLGEISLEVDGEVVLLKFNRGNFRVLTTSDGFVLEDIERPLILEDQGGLAKRTELIMTQGRLEAVKLAR